MALRHVSKYDPFTDHSIPWTHLFSAKYPRLKLQRIDEKFPCLKIVIDFLVGIKKNSAQNGGGTKNKANSLETEDLDSGRLSGLDCMQSKISDYDGPFYPDCLGDVESGKPDCDQLNSLDGLESKKFNFLESDNIKSCMKSSSGTDVNSNTLTNMDSNTVIKTEKYLTTDAIKLEEGNPKKPATRNVKKTRLQDRKISDITCRTCKKCGLIVQRARYLKIHELTHSGNRPYECNECGKRFLHKFNLRSHVLTHIGIRPYQCSVCEKSFLFDSNLQYHLRTHNGAKSHICKTCGKGFMQASDLKNHSLTHSNSRPHQCKKCGKTFRQISHLITHTRRKHPVTQK
ncbi:neurotrophin receptor-interacting factor homolog [Periplaneta americana]|uniref:neurotrophin receptor-interacting factor homolog n=1 Tax=Periplaneta americana TaxID=6978 RepID=UPI0037E955A6